MRIEQACEASCPVTTTCDPMSSYDSAEDCIAGCIASDGWDELDQCDWGSTAFMLCLGTLTCEQLLEYNSFVMEGTTLSPEWPCLVELDWLYNCDPDQPFAQPE